MQVQEATYQAPTWNLGNLAWQNQVINRTTSAPPGSPAIGDRYVVGSAPTGAWSGQVNNIAQWTGATWVFFIPSVGETTWSTADSAWYTWFSGSWQIKLSGSGNVTMASIAQTQAGTPSGLAADIGGLLFINRGAGSNKNYCGGDFTGNVGAVANSLDVQSGRSSGAVAATATQSQAFGYNNTASGSQSTAMGYTNSATAANCTAVGSINSAGTATSTAVGYNNTASQTSCTALGYTNSATSGSSSAIGFNNTASGINSSALGYKAVARLQNTTNICGPIINRKDNSDGGNGTPNFQVFGGAAVVLMTNNVDMTVLSTTTIAIPTGAAFYVDEVGAIAINVASLTTQPTLTFGNSTGGNSFYLGASTATTLNAAYSRQRYDSSSLSNMNTPTVNGATLNAVVSTAGTVSSGGALLGRFYWRGILMEQ